jgi:hypothetical protein
VLWCFVKEGAWLWADLPSNVSYQMSINEIPIPGIRTGLAPLGLSYNMKKKVIRVGGQMTSFYILEVLNFCARVIVFVVVLFIHSPLGMRGSKIIKSVFTLVQYIKFYVLCTSML